MQKYKKLSTTVYFVIWTLILLVPKTYGQEEPIFVPTACNQGGYQSITQLPDGEFEVYIEPGEMQDSQISVYYQDISDPQSCELLLQASNQKTIQSIGNIQVSNGGKIGNFVIPTSGQVDFGSPNAPKVILRPRGSICDPITGCVVNYRGVYFELQPKVLSLKSDSFKIAVLEPIEGQEISEVVYSINGRPAYKTSELQAFNLKYVPPGEHELQRTIIFKNGQTLSDSQFSEQSFAPQNFITSYYYRYQDTIRLFLMILLLLFIWLSVSYVYRTIRKRIAWNRSHIAGVTTKTKDKSAVLRADNRIEVTGPLKKGVLVVSVTVLAFMAVTSWFISVFTVDGLSMFSTLQNKSTKPLNKLPVTFSKLNRRDYVPKRGEIIVFNHSEDNLFDPTFVQQKRYMVKRVIALPGERITLRDGRLTVYNDEFPNGFDPDKNVAWEDKIQPTPNKVFDVKLEAGEIFVAGDNRPESIDSRYYGPIKASDIVGVVIN